jgi:hypothetical protein
VFEQHREHKADRAREAFRHDWQARHDAYGELIDTARTFTGTSAEGILLAPGESVFLEVEGTALIEERRGRGTYVGHSQGISVPVMRAGGRQIRYRVGASKGHYVQGEPSPTAIDTGTTFVTSSRVVFRGGAQTRECAFDKLIGFEHDDESGTTTLSVSNRSKPTTIHYGPACAATFDFRLDLALAHFRHTLDELVRGLEADLAAVDAGRPEGPSDQGPPPPPPVGSAPPDVHSVRPDVGREIGTPDATAVVGGWYRDPWGAAAFRWWDGTAWSWRTVDPATLSGRPGAGPVDTTGPGMGASPPGPG